MDKKPTFAELFALSRRLNHMLHHFIKDSVRYMAGRPPLSGKELSDALGFDKAHTSRVLLELAELGFACREGSKNGLYSLTQEGLEWAQELKEVFRRADRLLPLYVSGEDMQRLSDISDSASEFLKRLSQEGGRHENT